LADQNRSHDKKTPESETNGHQSLIDPYESGMVTNPMIIGRPGMECRVVAVLTSVKEKRGLKLIHPQTRCLRKNDIHELLMTDEPDAGPGARVDRVTGIAFVEFTTGGVMIKGDAVLVGDVPIGEIAGFDETHMPNHYNILMKSRKRVTGKDLGLNAGDKIFIAADMHRGENA